MDSNVPNTPPTPGPAPAAPDVDWVKAVAGAGLMFLGGTRSTLSPVLRVAAVAGGGVLLYDVAKRAGWLQRLEEVAVSLAAAGGKEEVSVEAPPAARTWDHPPSTSASGPGFGESLTAVADPFESATAEGPKKTSASYPLSPPHLDKA